MLGQCVKLPQQANGNGTGLQERDAATSSIRRGSSDARPVDLDFVSRKDLCSRVVTSSDIERFKLLPNLIDPKAVEIINAEMAKRHKMLPLMVIGEILIVAMADPLNVVAIDNMKLASGLTIKPVICDEQEILDAIDYCFGENGKHLKVGEDWRNSPLTYITPQEMGADSEQKHSEDEAPIISLLNNILAQAIEEGASDIHIEPAENLGRVRYRLDGVLQEASVIPKEIVAPLVSRIKVISSLDIAEKRMPQDGRFFVRFKKRNVDLRVATLPTVTGEACVIRLLDQSKSNVKLDSLGLTDKQRNLIVKGLAKTSGLVLVTGPTGSGKTTTLCGMLNYVNSLDKKIITLEDPVEYRFDIVNQVSTNPVAGLTYAAGLRSVLRNDPDVVLVGEIRDLQSASTAVQAALTGHLLLSTLHTVGTAQTIMRLLDLGVESFYVREVLQLIVAQRLVRTLCPHCKQPYDPSPEARAELGHFYGSAPLFRSVGCPECRNTGYSGRTAVFEILPMTNGLRRLLTPTTAVQEIADFAKTQGFRTLWDNALEKVLLGETSLEEISGRVPHSGRFASEEESPPLANRCAV
jgi:type IV pilus assembly protein PilB